MVAGPVFIHFFHETNNLHVYPLYVGAFFNKQARESSLAKASLGAFPPIAIAPRNAKLKRAVDFSRASRICFHAAIYKCFDDFNRKNGTVVTLQNGNEMNMAKAIILAFFATIQQHGNAAYVGQTARNVFAANPTLQRNQSVVRCSCEPLGTLQPKNRSPIGCLFRCLF